MRQTLLSSHAHKSEFMVIRHSKQHNSLSELNELYEPELEYLNIYKSLSWKVQYKKCKAMVRNDLSALQTLKDSPSQSMLAFVCQELIESHLRYGNVAFQIPS